MTLISTQDREEAKRRFIGQLKSGPSDWKEALAEACIDSFRQMEIPKLRQGTDRLEIGVLFQRFRWVIRDDDLRLADSLLKATAAAASANFFVGEVTTSAVVGVVSGLFCMCRAIEKKGAKLSSEQCTLTGCAQI